MSQNLVELVAMLKEQVRILQDRVDNLLDDAGNVSAATLAGSPIHTHASGSEGGPLRGADVESFIDFKEVAAPATPASGYVRIYAKTDGLLYQKDDAGSETAL